MHTTTRRADPERPEPDVIAEAAAVLRRGGLVAFPTETVYGLGANALDAAAVEKIFAAKGRPPTNPVIVHVSDPSMAAPLAADWPAAARRLAAHFWPGSLTLVVPKSAAVPAAVTAGGPTVGLRMPDHPVALALIAAAGVPVAAPSANPSNRLSPTTADHVRAELDGLIDFLLDGGPCPGGLESTVLDLTTTPPQILRPGLVTPAELEAVIGPVRRPAAPAAGAEPAAFKSPGMLARHYAPRAPLRLVSGGVGEAVAELAGRGLRVGCLAFAAPQADHPGVTCEVLPADPGTYSAALYAALHRLDGAGVDAIVVELPPDTEAWLAVRDRLRRASQSG